MWRQIFIFGKSKSRLFKMSWWFYMFLLPHVSFASEKCIQALSQGEHLIFPCMLLHEDAVHMITFNSTLQSRVLQKQGTREKPVKVGTIKPHQAKQDKSWIIFITCVINLMSLLCCILCSGFVFVNPGGFSRRHFEGDRSFAVWTVQRWVFLSECCF